MQDLRHTVVLTALFGLLASACERAPEPIGPPPFDLTASLSLASNDNFGDATAIATLPFSNTVDISDATTEPPDEPTASCTFGSASGRTVWYSFTATTTGMVSASTDQYASVVAAYTGPSLGVLTEIGCRSPYAANATFLAQAGTTYYFQVDGMFGFSGTLTFQLLPPPPNDDFANAIVIGGLPFTSTINTAAASTESGEPTSSCVNPANNTAWYTFTPSQSGSISASVVNASFATVVTAFSGTSLSGLTELRCRVYGERVTFHAEAGTTYYFQVGTYYGQGGQVEFSLDVAPPPVAAFSFSPSDPSVFDVVQFFGYYSYDPAGVGIQSYQWDFGDGASATGTDCCSTHRYATDGGYGVQLTVTTPDGRSASTSQTVVVRTHDVAITKFLVPKSASAGQTRQVTVGLNSKRYPEAVEVQLFRSVPGGGYQFVGSLVQSVPVRPSNRTTDFNFSYTFTAADALVGKVTFRAIAGLQNARDALPADNEAIAAPTKVSR